MVDDNIVAELHSRDEAPGRASAERVGDFGDDVALACACAEGDATAIAELERSALGPAGEHARASGVPAQLVDDALQIARVRLVLGEDGKPPALRAYRGRGPLAAFVRTAVLRIAIDLQRRDRETPDEHIEAMLVASQPDPELEYMRRQYAASLGGALRTAWRALAPHDRFVLGLQLHEKLDLDAIAKIYQVHRATAARRAASARAQLIALTREALRRELAIGDTTLDSILRVVTTSVAWSALERESPR